MFRYFFLIAGLGLLFLFWIDFKSYQSKSLIYEEIQQYAMTKSIKPMAIDSVLASLILAHQRGGEGNQYNVIMNLMFEIEPGRLGKVRTGGRFDGNKGLYPHGHPKKWLDSTFQVIYIPKGAPVLHVQKDGYAIYYNDGSYGGDNTPHYTYFDEPDLSFWKILIGLILLGLSGNSFWRKR